MHIRIHTLAKTALAMLAACHFPVAAQGQAQEKTIAVEITNDWGEAKTDEPVVLSLHNLHTRFDVRSAIVRDGEQELPSQLDDLDRDARADELAFLVDLPAHRKKQLRIVLSSQQKETTYPARAYAQLLAYGKKNKPVKVTGYEAAGDANVYNCVHHHGVAFESELVAYRIYFNEKQTVDPYSKVKKQLELQQTNFYPTAEQRAAGYGDDALRVYNSGGVGALKGWDGTAATHIAPVVNRAQRVLASGPVRAIVEVEVTGWDYQGRRLNMTNRYTLYGGHRDVRVDVCFDRPLDEETFVAGVQRLKAGGHTSDHHGLVGSWGTDWPVNDTVNHVKETTGMGTFIPRHTVEEVADEANYLYTLRAKGARSFHYYTTFTSQKESFGFGSMQAWFDHLAHWREALEHPCRVRIK